MAKFPIIGNDAARLPGLLNRQLSEIWPVTRVFVHPIGGVEPVAEEKSSFKKYTCPFTNMEQKTINVNNKTFFTDLILGFITDYDQISDFSGDWIWGKGYNDF